MNKNYKPYISIMSKQKIDFNFSIRTSFLILFAIIIQSNVWPQARNDFEIAKNLDIFTTLYRTLNTNYVDDLNHGEMFETAMISMLESLDPYTNYIPEAQREDFLFMTTGQYGGIGALIQQRGDYTIVSEPYEGAPAQKTGLIAGDKILEINGQSAQNKSVSDVSTILKGQPGTDLSLLIERKGQPEPILFSITRENVKIDDIPYFGLLEGDIAYINLSGFTQSASSEVKKAFDDLNNQTELKGLIIDLRGNGGGLLSEAVDIVGMFVPSGEMVVSTKGKLRETNRVHKTSGTPKVPDIPVTILVDNNSASASEIVAGALQDLDRAVVIGQRTLGKGLVQNVIPLTYNTSLKVTVAKYYIPSGRCIQAIDYFHKDENGDHIVIPDSLKVAFTTRNGRTVYESAGIEPDIAIEPRTVGNITRALITNYMIFDFANQFYLNNGEIAAADEFEITEAIFNDFKTYIADKKLEYKNSSEISLDKLKESVQDEKYHDKVHEMIAAIEEEIERSKEVDLETFSQEIKDILLSEIVSRYYYQRGRVIAALPKDRAVNKAIEVLRDQDQFMKITGNKTKPDNKDKG
jgi:carboxyl-terminal processing protease